MPFLLIRALMLPLWSILAAALLGGCATPPTDALVLAKRSSFFVGGKTIASTTLSTGAMFPDSGTVTTEQMYVSQMVPSSQSGLPMVFIHGCCLTGKTWESTPDWRAGWDEVFVRAGHPTYVVDQVSRGRSASNTTNVTAVKLAKMAPSNLEAVFLASRESAWQIFRFGPKYPEQYRDTNFPMESIEEFWKQMVPDWNFSFGPTNPNVENLALLAERAGRSILVSHSQSGIYPFLVARDHKAPIAAIVAVEPGSCPDSTWRLEALKGIPILILWGEHNEESKFWAPRMQQCREFAQRAAREALQVDFVMLKDVGFPNASHMLMQDRNSHEIARWIDAWLARSVSRPAS